MSTRLQAARDEAAKRLEEVCGEKDQLNARAMRRFEQGLPDFFTPEMNAEHDRLDREIHRLCDEIRNANVAESIREAEKHPIEVPLH